MVSVLQKIQRLRFRGPSPSTQAAYEALVLRIANGEHVDESEIADALDGRAPGDLQSDVKRLLDRRQAIIDKAEAEAQHKQHEAMVADVRTAAAAIEALPIVQALNELEAKKQELARLREAVQGFGAAAGAKRSRAMWISQTTASKSIQERMKELGGEINVHQHDRDRLALTSAESDEHQAALNEIGSLPKKITGLKRVKTSEAAAESAAPDGAACVTQAIVGALQRANRRSGTARSRDCQARRRDRKGFRTCDDSRGNGIQKQTRPHGLLKPRRPACALPKFVFPLCARPPGV